jgi:hypothetical protein
MTTFVFHNDYEGTEIMNLEDDAANRFKSACHNQPLMENTAVFVGDNQGAGFCRRCGQFGALVDAITLRHESFEYASSLDN